MQLTRVLDLIPTKNTAFFMEINIYQIKYKYILLNGHFIRLSPRHSNYQ